MKNYSQRIRVTISTIITTAVVALTVFVICRFVIGITIVEGHSMENTLQDQDKLLILKICDFERYDIIVFEKDNENYIKRVIGLPGEKVRIGGDYVYINGRKLTDEIFGKEKMGTAGCAIKEITLGPNEYFVLGDNRKGSKDSRDQTMGNINRNQIMGKVLFRLYPNFGGVKQ